MTTVEETKSGGKQAYGTHNYPDHLTHIDKLTWDVIVVGAGPAGLMLTVSGTKGRGRPFLPGGATTKGG